MDSGLLAPPGPEMTAAQLINLKPEGAGKGYRLSTIEQEYF